MKSYILAVVLMFSAFSSAAIAHSGGTDANGCHHDHIHGGYHCH